MEDLSTCFVNIISGHQPKECPHTFAAVSHVAHNARMALLPQTRTVNRSGGAHTTNRYQDPVADIYGCFRHMERLYLFRCFDAQVTAYKYRPPSTECIRTTHPTRSTIILAILSLTRVPKDVFRISFSRGFDLGFSFNDEFGIST